MENFQQFIQHINSGYTPNGYFITLGAVMWDGIPNPETQVKIQYCDHNCLPLLDLKDPKKIFQFLTSNGKK